MGRISRLILAALVLALFLGPGAGRAQAGWGTPLWGWDDDSFSLWPVLYVGDGGFSIPLIRVTDHSCSIPLIHYESAPEDRFDLTPVYHYTEGQEGFALGPRRNTINNGLQGLGDLVYDLLTLGTNTRQYLADDPQGYERYREYGVSERILPGEPYPGREGVSLEGKIEAVSPEEQAEAEAATMQSETPEEKSFEDQKDPVAGPDTM